ncbi:MAG: hypothetical protein WKG06_25390 [Segetibacter sp.]
MKESKKANRCTPAVPEFNVEVAMKQAGFKDKGFSAHTLRHSFATHLLGYRYGPSHH